MGFEELEHDPVGEMRKLYASLDLPEFGIVEPVLWACLVAQSEYGKNEFPALAMDDRRRVADAWRRCFEEWGYNS